MPKPTFLFIPPWKALRPLGEAAPVRHSLFDTKEDFIRRIAPLGVAAIYFGSFSLSPQDAPLSRQALFKLSFLNRHFLQPGGLKIVVNRQTANLSGKVPNRVARHDGRNSRSADRRHPHVSRTRRRSRRRRKSRCNAGPSRKRKWRANLSNFFLPPTRRSAPACRSARRTAT